MRKAQQAYDNTEHPDYYCDDEPEWRTKRLTILVSYHPDAEPWLDREIIRAIGSNGKIECLEVGE